MKIGLAQINSTVGDLEGNVNRCLAAISEAAAGGADFVVLPEMAVPGYPPRDILNDASFVAATADATADLARRAHDLPPAVVGTVLPGPYRTPHHPGLYNSAALINDGRIQTATAKRLLPAYGVFHEPRWFLPGGASEPVTVAGARIGLLICEDLWDEMYPAHPPADLMAAGARVLVNISASPYRQGIAEERLHHARRPGAPLICVNACGAQDELIFDGRSFAVDGKGRILTMLPAFAEEVRVIDLAKAAPITPPSLDPDEILFRALVLGVRDFAAKNGIGHGFLGLSGGIDSAVTAAIAAQAMGADAITAVAMPSRFTDERSTKCAEELASSLGIGFEIVPIEDLHRAAEESLGSLLEGGTTAENVQARLRAMILMAHVNRHCGMLLNTSNKTEVSLGYSTLYGDMAGTLCPIADVTKPEVVSLARWIDRHHCPIPEFTRERPPTAELKADQVDPFDYDEVGPARERLVAADQSDGALRHSEHKRWQMGVILKVSETAFGSGRMIPITRK